MDSQPFDPSGDPFLAFTSETPIVPTQDSEPASTCTPTLGEQQHSIALLNNQGPEGTHEVRVELAGFSPSVTSVRVKDGRRARVGVSLEVEG